MIQSEEHIQIREAAQLSIAGLSLWFHGRQFPESQQYWDGNWMNVTAYCWADGAEVRISGPFVHLSEVVRWAEESAQLHATLSGEANLACLEPELCVTLQAMSRGQIEMTVDITPDPHTQVHQFCFEIDQSYVPQLIRQCHGILEEFPLRDPEQQTQHHRGNHGA
jgi:hypothetical protein